MAETTDLTPLRWQDVLPQYCTVEVLGKLAYLYRDDVESTQLIVDELERRGIDPYA